MLSIVWGCVEMCYTLIECDKVNIKRYYMLMMSFIKTTCVD